MDWGIISKYQFGYVAEPLPGDYRFTGRLAIPYLSRHGVTSIRFRDLTGRQGHKYDVHSGTTSRLYNTLAFDAGTTIGITEGEIDAVAATEHLDLPSVGVPGVQNWDTRHFKPPFRDFQHVVILADGDEPGLDFAKLVAEDIGWKAIIAQCPLGEDVSSMVAQGRSAELKALYSTSNQEDAA